MKIFNFGSINIDHVYEVGHFARPGETLGSSGYKIFADGKEFNQFFAGRIEIKVGSDDGR